ncbi:hypothetical protein TWF481_002962 [Arthrobotrys musiformis]|uniref:C2H2-type domain-containing protein n=1 Tax=Arthrobotrys musiformis TaxID=47236 RepID=A0AAV9VT18_9PEZI
MQNDLFQGAREKKESGWVGRDRVEDEEFSEDMRRKRWDILTSMERLSIDIAATAATIDSNSGSGSSFEVEFTRYEGERPFTNMLYDAMQQGTAPTIPPSPEPTIPPAKPASSFFADEVAPDAQALDTAALDIDEEDYPITDNYDELFAARNLEREREYRERRAAELVRRNVAPARPGGTQHAAAPYDKYRFEPKTHFRRANPGKMPMKFQNERKPISCDNCGEEFGSYNKLHDHLRDKGHYRPKEKKAKFTIVDSDSSAPTPDDDGPIPEMSNNFQYMTIPIAYDESVEKKHAGTPDSGFGYSAVDRTFLTKVIEPVQTVRKGMLPFKYLVDGFGGGTDELKEWALITLYIPDETGKTVARIRRRFMISNNLGANILIGNNIMITEGIDVSPRNGCVYLRRHGDIKVPASVYKQSLPKEVPVRTTNNVAAEPGCVRPVHLPPLSPASRSTSICPPRAPKNYLLRLFGRPFELVWVDI